MGILTAVLTMTVYKYVKALTPIRLFNGGLWMEEEDISRITEEKFNLSEIQTAITNNELVEVNENDLPVDVVSPTFKFRGNWDASNNQLPQYRRIGDSYKISGAGTVNAIDLEVGQRVIFPTSIDEFEVLGSSGGGGGATTLLGLTDTPSSYTGQAGKLLAVAQTEDGTEFIDNPGKTWVYVNSNFNVVLGESYIVDTSAATVTGTLPNTLPNDYSLDIKDASNGGDFSINSFFLARGASATYTIMGDTNSFEVDVASPMLNFVFDVTNDNLII